MTTEGQSFLDTINNFLHNDRTMLPVFNATGIKVQNEVAKAEPDSALIEHLIINDQALTCQVLRTANSAFYRGLVKVTTVRNAIVRLGLREIANIVMLASQRTLYTSKNPYIKSVMNNLWRHSVGCAIGSQWLAMHFGFKTKAAEAFTAGLLHDMGKLFILMVADYIARPKVHGRLPSEGLLVEVMENFHTQVGYDLFSYWNLPEAYAQIARDHHMDDLNTMDTTLVVVRLANLACNKIGIGLKKESDMLLAVSPEANQLGLSEVKLAELEIKLEDAIALAAV